MTGRRCSPTSKSSSARHRVLCRSAGRKDKEAAILDRFLARLEAGLHALKAQAEQERLRDRQKAERRIRRLLERNSRAASLFTVTMTEIAVGAAERRQRSPAHQLAGGRSDDHLDALHPVYRSGRRLPDRTVGSRDAADLPSTTGPDSGPYPGLCSGPGHVANAAAVDEGGWTRHRAETAP